MELLHGAASAPTVNMNSPGQGWAPRRACAVSSSSELMTFTPGLCRWREGLGLVLLSGASQSYPLEIVWQDMPWLHLGTKSMRNEGPGAKELQIEWRKAL
jgi:hypothetical protein